MTTIAANLEQRIPATVYGNTNCPLGFEVRVCKDAATECKNLKAAGVDAIVYHFNSNGGISMNKQYF